MSAKTPKYAELYSELRHAILSGIYQDGAFLPTEGELMKQWGVSQTTVRHAIRLLRRHNLVEVKQGCGTKVLFPEQKAIAFAKYGNPTSKLSVEVRYATQGRGEISNTKAAIDKIPAGEYAARALCVNTGDTIYRIQRLQLVDGIPFGYMVNYTTDQIAPDLMEKGELITDLYGHLYRHYGVKVLEIEETGDAMAAGFMEAQYLQVDMNTPLVVLRRVARGTSGPVEYCETIVRPDMFHMTVKIKPHEIPVEESLPFGCCP